MSNAQAVQDWRRQSGGGGEADLDFSSAPWREALSILDLDRFDGAFQQPNLSSHLHLDTHTAQLTSCQSRPIPYGRPCAHGPQLAAHRSRYRWNRSDKSNSKYCCVAA